MIEKVQHSFPRFRCEVGGSVYLGANMRECFYNWWRECL